VLNPEAKPYTIILPGKTYDIPFHRHHIHQNGYAQRYDRLVDVIDPGFMPCGMVHGAKSWLINAPEMWRIGQETLRKDEFFFVDRMENK